MVACYVTAIATVTELGTYVALGNLYIETESWHHMVPGLATRGRNLKIQRNAIAPLIMAVACWISLWQVLLGRRYHTSSGFLI